ncbi:phosphoenolpyruvate synthase [Salibacterium aidingense]|uniref:phosphoenolpyruvate synthase n=1 Tax=Salibacterium aidingense TaxID=384933 RepID=UPI00041CBDDB|nr:phosphoenolpyruvate synthase [Salibacterium aidingense]
MTSYVLFFHEMDRSSLKEAGGKGANLGELSQAGFPVPEGFCVTTSAYQTFLAESGEIDALLDALNDLEPQDNEKCRQLGSRLRGLLESLPVPEEIQKAVRGAWQSIGTEHAYAVRSSATAEDLPTASFAGQQDTYLNIRGEAELMEHIRKCWASLFTDRAITYRSKNGFDHRQVFLSVVVLRMLHPEISGIAFTADPANGNRRVVSIDASFGLGEAIVSGMVSADLYKVKHDRIIHKNISRKREAIFNLPEGGTITKNLPSGQQTQQALPDKNILETTRLAKQIEARFGAPQDIEFCLENGEMYVVQSRPITSLYPRPKVPEEPLRVFYSAGHFQMMTDAMKPLGLAGMKTILPLPGKYVHETGGRLYIDFTGVLCHKIGQNVFLRMMKNMDDAAARAMEEVMNRPAFSWHPSRRLPLRFLLTRGQPLLRQVWGTLFRREPQTVAAEVNTFIDIKAAGIREELQQADGTRRLELARSSLKHFFNDIVFPSIFHYVASFFISSAILKKLLRRWTGAEKEIQELNKSLPGNITSEMGLAIGDLADTLRGLPEVEVYLKAAENETFFEGLANIEGGETFKNEFEHFLRRYGTRCPGEIDMTRPRWREAPTQLVSAIVGHKQSVEPGAHREKFRQGQKAAKAAEQRILTSLRHSRFKTKIMKRFIRNYRYYGGLREHHKYLLTVLLDECKKAVMAEAASLSQKGILSTPEDVYFLTLDELTRAVKEHDPRHITRLISERRQEHEQNKKRQPPRVMTSEGESVTVPRAGHFPENALVGSPVSTGTAEGKARVILSPEEVALHEGEILVAPHTDPGWTPLFPSARALVTEVGGLMTHGSVVAREYGIPAVVGIDEATTSIQTGDIIRVDGEQGTVEILKNEKEE